MAKNISRFNPLYLAVFIIFFSLEIVAQERTDYAIVENKAKLPILTPDLLQVKTVKIKLNNGVEAYLISDPKTDKSGALMSVNVGSWEDPIEHPGIAHFLEHMLFLGTKKYPEEAGYHRFISEHGGYTNAFTTNTHTNYMFDVNNNAFPEALDRFASFFKDPLLNPSGVSRELNAIDQEYAKNLENDDWRLLFVDKELSNAEHPFHNFNIGNSTTLAKVSRETLERWYRDHYSANLMKLIIVSALPMEQLLNFVVEDFKDVPNNNRQPFAIEKNALNDEAQGKMVYIEPVKDTRTLTIVWELPPQFAKMKDSQPTMLLCSILGHEGAESLLRQLKQENLAVELSCGRYNMGVNNVEFYIEVTLTDEGVKDIDSVISRCFQAIANLREKLIPRYIFDETQRMAVLNYQYQPREDVFYNLMKQADAINEEDLATYPEQSRIIQKYDPDAIKMLLEFLTPQKAHYYLTAPSYLTKAAFDRKEKWLGTSYTIKPIDPELMAKWIQVTSHPQIDLPAVNPFIPQHLNLYDFSLRQKEERIIPIPEAILNDKFGIVYYSPDKYFRVPQTSVRFQIKTPEIDEGIAYSAVIVDLYARLLSNALSNISYPASLAGLSYEIKRTHFGLGIIVEGYSDHIDLLVEEIIKQMKEMTPTEEEFNTYKESLKREYQNFSKKSPLEQAFEVFRTAIFKRYATERQKAAVINKVTLETFKESLSELFKETFTEGMIYGNIDKKSALNLSQKFLTAVKSNPYPKEEQKHREVIVLPEKQGPFYFETQTKMQGNAIVLAIEEDQFDFKNWASQQILMQAMKEPFFSELRTRQQTGYIVTSDSLEVEKHLFNIFAVQSNSHSVRDLLARFELFIENYLQEINIEMPEQRFDLIKSALINILEQPPKDVSAMGDLLQTLAFERDGDFDWITKRIIGLKELTYNEFLNQTMATMGKYNKKRLAILLNGMIPKERIFNYVPLKSLANLRRMSHYSAGE